MSSFPVTSRFATASTELSLSSSAQALFYASRPPSPHSSRNLNQQTSQWDDTDDERWDDAPEQSRWSSSQPPSRVNSYSRSRFSDEDNSDDDRYGAPDVDGADHNSASGASSYATAPTSADGMDATHLDDKPARFYRQSAREAEAYRHLSLARRPSPTPDPVHNTFLLPEMNNQSQSPPSPIPSPTLPLNIKKKPGTSPASPNFSPTAVPHATLNGMPPSDNELYLKNTRDPATNARSSNTSSSIAYSVTGYSGSPAGAYRSSTLSRTSMSPPLAHQAAAEPFTVHRTQQPHAQQQTTQDTSDDGSSEPEAGAGPDSDDDVPLGQRIPNALKAQQSIRAKDKEDRARRRAERAARKPAMPTLGPKRATTEPASIGPLAKQPWSSQGPARASPPRPYNASAQASDFADDLTRRLAQVKAPPGHEDESQFGLALTQESSNTGSTSRLPRSPPATYRGVARAPPPDAFRPHEEMLLRRQSSQPHIQQDHSRHASVGSIRSVGKEKEMGTPSPEMAGASPDVMLRRYASVSRGSRQLDVRSRPPSPPRGPPQDPVPSSSQPISRMQTLARSRRPSTADGERHRVIPPGRPSTADRDARPPAGAMSVSRPGSPVMRPPSPSLSGMTPDERLKQLAMGRRGRSTSTSQRQPMSPPLSTNVVPLPPQLPPLRHQGPSHHPSTGPLEWPSQPDTPNLVSVSSPQQQAEFGIRPPSPSMAALTPDERLRQIAAKARARAPAPVAPAPAPQGGFRKRAMSLGRPASRDETAPVRSKTLVNKSRAAAVAAAAAAAALPPVPQSPVNFIASKPNERPILVVDSVGATQKVLIADVAPGQRAREIIDQLGADLPGDVHGWMLYEVCNDIGLERPIREFEIPAECCARWPAQGNTFAVRQTRYSRLLAQSAVPSVPPAHGSYVEFEIKRGKWSKRWLELRENTLYVSKRENAKDAVAICSLSNFDVYSTTRPVVKPPRFAFTLRSTDDLSMFENPADSMHSFCAPDAREGDRWIERIMVARSYVLSQERTALFRLPPPSNGASYGQRQRPTAPLLNVRALAQAAGVLSPSPASARPDNMKFEPGSLLAARAAASERV